MKKKIYENLRYRIITNELSPGQQLFEKELMEEYRIGRTPLREILQELKRNGLLEIIPKLGTRVVNLDMRTLREIIQLRRELEGLAAELATANIKPEDIARLRQLLDSTSQSGSDNLLKTLSSIDIEFHQIIYNSAGNRQLQEILESLLYKMSMYWFQVGFSVGDFHEQFEELEELMSAIEERNAPEARRIMKRHIDHFTSLLKENFFQ